MGGEAGQETLTILFTDVEGSTAFRTRVGDAAGNQVMAAHEQLVADHVRNHDGRLIKSLGDGCLAVFASPRRALDCAVAVQRATRSAPLRVRMGLNTGEVTITTDDVFGAPVNAAARIAGKAQGGEILISDVVRQLIGSTAGFELRTRGRVRLRGFPERWRLHEVVWHDEPPAGGPPELTPFVGRAAELARLHRVLDSVASGRGAVVLIRGEAGIGKTRLATEALDQARSRGWRILTGQASPLGTGLGLEPILAAFGGFLRAQEQHALQTLTADLPHLARLFEGLGLPPPPPVGDPALERTLLFESVARLLERLARQSPVVLLVDDLQWADPASIELVHQLTQDIERHPVTLMLTYRSGERPETGRLRQLLVALRRSASIEEMELQRLDRQAVEALAREFLGGRVPASLLDILVRAGGTPLFIDAFLRGLLDRGQLTRVADAWTLTDTSIEVPAAVRDLILERLDGLDSDARRVVELVALTGAALPHDVLAETGELGPDTLTDAVEHLTAVGVLAEEIDAADLAYRLTHPLYQEVAAGALSEIGRRRGHAALASALERVAPSDLEGLGRHYLAAGPALDRSRALEVLTAAGGRAVRRGGYDEAVRFLDAAVTLARQADDRPALASLLEHLAEARQRSGQTDAAVAAWTEALEIVKVSGEPTTIARIHRALGVAEFDRGRLVDGLEHLDRAAERLAEDPPSPEHGSVHFARVTLLRRLGWGDELLMVAGQLEDVATALGSALTRAQAHYARASALVDHGRPAQALGHATEGLEWAREAGDDTVTYRLHTVCCDAAAALGDHARVLHHGHAGRELLSTLGVAVVAGGAGLYRALGAFQAGAWDDALALSDEDLEVARRADNARLTASVLAGRAWLLAFRGDLDEAEALVREVRQGSDPSAQADRRGFGFISIAEARLAIEQGQPERAVAALGPDRTAMSNRAGTWAWVGIEPEVLARAGDIAGARRAAEALSAVSSPLIEAETAYAEGLIRLATSDLDGAPEELLRSIELFEGLRMPFHSARSRLELAAALVDSDPTRATDEAEQALATFERAPAKRYADRARLLLGRLGIRSRPPRRPSVPEGPLSRRELEVALLVADGLTNAEIADRLTVSVRTVTSHLDHIYTRLGINSRVALARHVAGERPAVRN
jgi:class 3 adenylate cyclase/DNA-binding CsgD family transcriptional regulator